MEAPTPPPLPSWILLSYALLLKGFTISFWRGFFVPVVVTFVVLFVERFDVLFVKVCCLMYEGFVVPVVKVLLSHFVQYFLVLSSTFSVVDNILF